MKMILKILFWFCIGWWFYPCKWIISKLVMNGLKDSCSPMVLKSLL